MVNEYLIQQTIEMFSVLVSKMIDPKYKRPRGGTSIRVVTNALIDLEKKFGALSINRIVDYVVCSLYVFKNKDKAIKINQVFGPKSLERFDSNKGRRYFEDKWLLSENITRNDLLKYLVDRSQHPLSKFIYLASEEGTKQRLLNQEVGYIICQTSTLGWSPESESCKSCLFTEKCKKETRTKYPEIYRLRLEYGNQNNN